MDEKFIMALQIIKNLELVSKEKMSKVHDVCNLKMILTFSCERLL